MVEAIGSVGSVELVPRPVAGSVDELLAGARRLGTFQPTDARSPAPFERVEVDGERCVVKFVHVDHDFAMRAAGDVGCLPRRAWETGLMDAAGDLIDHATLGAARWGRNGWGVALLMRDVSGDLVPAGDDPIPEALHAALIDHLAGLSARFWGWHDDLDLLPIGRRWEFFSPTMVASERALGFPEAVPRIAGEGWLAFAERAPRDVASVVEELSIDASGLVAALAATPTTFVHGDWKLGNLGRTAGGRTVLLDWAYVGEGY
ncbi:MAG: aminoglycoside phosphotransferase, partial [Acidimicrobiia bacterium]